MVGAPATTTDLPIATAVTCPLIRTHPAVIAQAAAAGYDVVHRAQIGGADEDFFRFAGDELLPALTG